MTAGRPIDLTPEIMAELAVAVKRTLFIETAADLVGMDRGTVRRWLKRGWKEPDTIFGEFSRTIKKALAEREGNSVECIFLAAIDTWTAAAWLLERRSPERWSREKAEIKALQRELTEIKSILYAKGLGRDAEGGTPVNGNGRARRAGADPE